MKYSYIKRWIITVAVCLLGQFVSAELRVNSIFESHMVLQRDTPVRIYGTADANETVWVEFAGQSRSGTADDDGDWGVVFDPMSASAEPRTLRLRTLSSELTLVDVLVGDVWLCGGQSNMQGRLSGYVKKFGDTLLFKDIPGAYHNDQIRLFVVSDEDSDAPLSEPVVSTSWTACTPESVLDFSCTAYFFGRHLHPEAGVPIGLVLSAVGGTGACSWMPWEVMKSNPVVYDAYIRGYEENVKNWSEVEAAWVAARNEARRKADAGEAKYVKPIPPVGTEDPKRPGAYYNAMIHPLHRFAVKGAIWYQGEHEAKRLLGDSYQTTLPLMISTWRERWGQGDFPFIIVQLPGYMGIDDAQVDSSIARVREAQTMTYQTVPNTGLAVITDRSSGVHCPYKNRLGNRLAAQALRVAYGKPVDAWVPTYSSIDIVDEKAVITFDDVGAGLTAQAVDLNPISTKSTQLRADELVGFIVAGEDHVFYPATAAVDGLNRVVVSSSHVPHPVAVRYAWADLPRCNLFTLDGFPASAFRTDAWAFCPQAKK